MFEMEKIGRRISQLRKKLDITQMELADRMNISFQAVSNWERGQSMPDIAKLGELSAILETTIDELLGNGRGTQVLQAISNETPLNDPLKAEELTAIAPLLKPTQVDRAVSRLKERVDLSELTGILPFLSEPVINELAQEFVRLNGLTNEMSPLLPFLNEDDIDALVRDAIREGKPLTECGSFFPFMHEKALQKYADALLEETGELNSITIVAPFLNTKYLTELAVKTAAAHGLHSIKTIAPFLETEAINQLAAESLEKDGLTALSPIMPFIDERVVEDYIRRKKPHIKHIN